MRIVKCTWFGLLGLAGAVTALAVFSCDIFIDPKEKCEQNCSDRECGPDPVCGLTCGSCGSGGIYNAEGRCVAELDGGDDGQPDGGDPGADEGADPGIDAGADAGVDAADENPDPCLNPALNCLVPQDRTAIDQGWDWDGDGWGSCCDCADADAQVHPWAFDEADGLDNNCNGLVDEPGGLMVQVPGHNNVWIDMFEVTVFENRDCTGTVYGQYDNDYPAGWPEEGAPTVTLYACSLPGVVPSGALSWYRARWACAAQGKRLCSAFEWEDACAHPATYTYPYGGEFIPGRCNDPFGGTGGAAATGAFPGCVSGLGVFDLSGNRAEWLENHHEDIINQHTVAGGSYDNQICHRFQGCTEFDAFNPTPDEEQIVRAWLDCGVDLWGDYEALYADRTRGILGTRCCYVP